MKDNAVGALKSYYTEANYIDHPSMYQYVGWYGMDVDATQEIVPLILKIIENNFTIELKDYIRKIQYAIANKDEEKIYSSIIQKLLTIQEDFNANIRSLITSISLTKSMRHKEKVEEINYK